MTYRHPAFVLKPQVLRPASCQSWHYMNHFLLTSLGFDPEITLRVRPQASSGVTPLLSGLCLASYLNFSMVRTIKILFIFVIFVARYLDFCLHHSLIFDHLFMHSNIKFENALFV